MKYLIEIHRLMLKYNTLKDKSYTNSKDIDNTLKDLLLNCLALIQNPFFSVMYELEYADTTDHEKYRTYFSKYPFIDYIYKLMILQKPNLLQMLTTIQASKKMTISILRQITMRKVRQIIIQTPSQTLKQISIQTL